jgi:hypothetical protein
MTQRWLNEMLKLFVQPIRYADKSSGVASCNFLCFFAVPASGFPLQTSRSGRPVAGSRSQELDVPSVRVDTSPLRLMKHSVQASDEHARLSNGIQRSFRVFGDRVRALALNAAAFVGHYLPQGELRHSQGELRH